jgi:hypothetical protein
MVPSIAQDYILRRLLSRVIYSVRPKRLLIELVNYNLLFRWFPSLGRRLVAEGPGVCGPEHGQRYMAPPCVLENYDWLLTADLAAVTCRSEQASQALHER